MNGAVIWLASYPKSGNTWMRVLLTNYVQDGETPVSINELSGEPIASARQLLDDNVGIEGSDLTQDEIERLRPYVYERISDRIVEEGSPRPVFLKVHDAYTRTSEGVPLIPKRATAGVVYLLRDPRDVAVSYAHHAGIGVGEAVDALGNPNHAFFDRASTINEQLRQRLSTWSGHVASWTTEPGLRVLTVRYEDLLADTGAALAAVVRFSGLDVDADRIAKAVEFSRFEELRAQESAEGFQERQPKAPMFFRQGSSGTWRSVLSPEHVAKLEGDHAEAMERFGYSTQPEGRMTP